MLACFEILKVSRFLQVKIAKSYAEERKAAEILPVLRCFCAAFK